ncbi:sucrase ferredoxin [Frankia sp. AgB1.9]|uniref:sucrase ferredoxin n=1 Tax=unclassified Frankia TaxID=2632575 RepID=UPI00193385D5|nr:MULTISPECIES: sucrase ferredoxin [unclassified Frankia]MBL7490083.1 sucrase ferredoxin [Frankia sp. AgW1.1]MBL7547128.1 sucrase ferredoxin [Frankia sp. AgB1.9]MBL7620066.1 sucrase ferredoxin [Frankia sp. AgB1.8]
MTQPNEVAPHHSTRCGAQSRSAAEDIRGTVPDVGAYCFLPAAGPWPHQVPPADPGLFPELPGARTQLYRPYPGQPTNEPAFFWDTTRRRIYRASRGGWQAAGPREWFLGVCVHGRHDTCCGLRGGGFLRRVKTLAPEAPVYGVSHLGGDRFSATAILLPGGYLLGRLDELDDEQVHDLVEHGLLPLGHVRGRLGSTQAESVAEIWYRELFGHRDPLTPPTTTVVSVPGDRGWSEVVVEAHEGRWRLAISREQRGERPIQYTCAAPLSRPVYGWEVDVLEEARAA